MRTSDDGKPASGPSLKARAVGYLSRREHSRLELGRKLARFGEEDEVRAVLDSLEKEGWLSTQRYAQSVVHRLAAKQGTLRIMHELRQHGVADAQIAELRDTLETTELARAREVWRKRFGTLPADASQRAKQVRFLMSRGFGQSTIRQVLRGVDLDDLDQD
ncbi:recombination regulator RecX [Pigmentiphaga sp. H8]|uniref:recombination regulator RecX n=1 Tax=unclassified Pigmentiphaga TaxID=2626614 RepID=UPI000F5997E2|nr:recombination regulator RecX [Pigmentiphaga sp. H8]AZG09998.1 recombination regulator RecX [Pigmentiphaga sp. H8]